MTECSGQARRFVERPGIVGIVLQPPLVQVSAELRRASRRADRTGLGECGEECLDPLLVCAGELLFVFFVWHIRKVKLTIEPRLRPRRSFRSGGSPQPAAA